MSRSFRLTALILTIFTFPIFGCEPLPPPPPNLGGGEPILQPEESDLACWIPRNMNFMNPTAEACYLKDRGCKDYKRTFPCGGCSVGDFKCCWAMDLPIEACACEQRECKSEFTRDTGSGMDALLATRNMVNCFTIATCPAGTPIPRE